MKNNQICIICDWIDRAKQFLSSDDIRSYKVKKNILWSTIIKVLDVITYLLLVPVTLNYLNAYEYGIWLTLSSVLIWIDSFDIGLGNGLRNKLAIAIASDDKEKARGYVSTTFYMLLVLVIIIFIIFLFVSSFINWYSLLNVDSEVVNNLYEIVVLSFAFYSLNFSLKFIGNVYQAMQMPAINSFIVFAAHLLSLVAILVMKQLLPGSLLYVALTYSAATPFVYMLCYPITFKKAYPFLAPSVSFFKKEYLKDLMTQGGVFFILQLTGIVFFSLTNVIISNLFGPDNVTSYNISYKYFSILLILFNLLMGPMWSAATDAYERNDIQWIRNSLSKLLKILRLVAVLLIVMVAVSPLVYKIWVGDSVTIPVQMSIIIGIYIFVLQYSSLYSSFLFGIGKLRVMLISNILFAVAFYPLCYFLSIPFGVFGVLLGMCTIHIVGAILNTIQLNKILDNKATGIWGK